MKSTQQLYLSGFWRCWAGSRALCALAMDAPVVRTLVEKRLVCAITYRNRNRQATLALSVLSV